MKKQLLLPILLACTLRVRAAEPDSPSVITVPSRIHRIAEKIRFDGKPYTWRQRALSWKITVGGESYIQPEEGGFVVEHTTAKQFSLYLPFDLAMAQGWYQAVDKDGIPKHGVPNGLDGIFRVRDSIWMGTKGVGLLEYHINGGTWSRYDVEQAATPGIHLMLIYADEEYLFATYGGAPPALCVYSMQKDRWLQINQISTKGAILGHSGEYVQVPTDYRGYASEKYIPISETYNYLSSPSKITLDSVTKEYVLDYGHDWNGAAPTKLRFKKGDLDQ